MEKISQLTFVSLLLLTFQKLVKGNQDITIQACFSVTKPVLTENRGSLQSYNFPNGYGDNRNCEWIIQPSGNKSVINFDVIKFSTESCCDKLKVYNMTDGLLLELSGGPYYKRHVFRENKLRILFTSDGSSSSSGFHINYEVVRDDPLADRACNPLTLPASITSTSALIQPLGRRNREYCFWTYYPQLGLDNEPAGIYISVNNVESLENGQLVIYAGEGKDGQVLFEYNGQTTSHHSECPQRGQRNLPFFRERALSIEYFGDINLVFERYFNVTVFQQDRACASGTARQIHLTSGSSSLQSPGYPYILPEYLSCNWVITTLPGQTIAVDNIELDLTENQDCDAEYLEILDGDGALANSFGRFCNVSSFHGVNSTGSSLQVILRSDYSYTQRKGFNLEFTVKGNENGSGSGDDEDDFEFESSVKT